MLRPFRGRSPRVESEDPGREIQQCKHTQREQTCRATASKVIRAGHLTAIRGLGGGAWCRLPKAHVCFHPRSVCAVVSDSLRPQAL